MGRSRPACYIFKLSCQIYVVLGLLIGVAQASDEECSQLMEGALQLKGEGVMAVGQDGSMQAHPESPEFAWFIESLPVDSGVTRIGGPKGELQFAGLQGSGVMEGKWYVDADGERWFVKKDLFHHELQSSAAVISSRIYRHFGYHVPDVYKVEHEGEYYTVSRDLGEDFAPRGLNDWVGAKARAMKFVAAYLSDTDREFNPGNVLFSEERGWALVDFGATLGAAGDGRCVEGPGQWSEAVGCFRPRVDYDSLFDEIVMLGKKNHPWRQVVFSDALHLKRYFESLSDRKLGKIVERGNYSRPEDAEHVLRVLVDRRDAFLRWLAAQ